jgi:hypothetical protein
LKTLHYRRHTKWLKNFFMRRICLLKYYLMTDVDCLESHCHTLWPWSKKSQHCHRWSSGATIWHRYHCSSVHPAGLNWVLLCRRDGAMFENCSKHGMQLLLLFPRIWVPIKMRDV